MAAFGCLCQVLRRLLEDYKANVKLLTKVRGLRRSWSWRGGWEDGPGDRGRGETRGGGEVSRGWELLATAFESRPVFPASNWRMTS